jgi:hypothetical protein
MRFVVTSYDSKGDQQEGESFEDIELLRDNLHASAADDYGLQVLEWAESDRDTELSVENGAWTDVWQKVTD